MVRCLRPRLAAQKPKIIRRFRPKAATRFWLKERRPRRQSAITFMIAFLFRHVRETSRGHSGIS